jgi:hypothetical protein
MGELTILLTIKYYIMTKATWLYIGIQIAIMAIGFEGSISGFADHFTIIWILGIVLAMWINKMLFAKYFDKPNKNR